MASLPKKPGLLLKLRVQMLLISTLFVVLVSLVTWTVVSRSQDALIEFEAIKLAEIVADQASAARSAYASLAVSKLSADGFGASEVSDSAKGHIPLPAQFLRELSRRSQSVPDAVFSFKPVSLWNLAPDQGIDDDFLEWAWAELEKQQASKVAGPMAWNPVWRIDDTNGEHMLRYLRSDPASSSSCVNCHNALEKRPDVIARRIDAGVVPGKQWQLHDLLGAIEIKIPLDQAVMLAKSQTQQGLFTVVGVTVIGLIGVALLVLMDSARSREMTARLSHQARHDSLTGLPNRLHFEMHVEGLLEEKHPFAVMILDLDNFKQINDTLGHEAGDTVLRESGRRISQVIPQPGFVARLGGDEFAVVVPGSDRETADRVAAEIAHTIDQTYCIESYDMAIGVSVGIALFPLHGEELSELMRCSDVAMYLAKNAGIDSAVYDSAHDHNHVSKLLLTSALREALATDQILVHFQPKYSLVSGRMTGVEALARWISTEHGVIPPDVFIPMAETLGLINELTATVLDQSLRECQQWRKRGFDLTVSVNLSAVSLVNSDAVDLIKQRLMSTGLPAEALIIEVTESAVMTDPDRAVVVLQELHDAGVRISVDDYGVGHCSLSYLTTLPISQLKLDKSFIQNINRDEKDALVVKATIDLTRNLKLQMVAEGVEDAATLDHLCAIGCDQVQGYFLCRPFSVSDLNRRLP